MTQTFKFLSCFHRSIRTTSQFSSYVPANLLRCCSYRITDDRNIHYKNAQKSALLSSAVFLQRNLLRDTSCIYLNHRTFKTSSNLLKGEKKIESDEIKEPEKKLSLYQKYKKMMKEYWYVLIPVHIVTSSIWFGCFYLTAKSGFDFMAILDLLNVPEVLIKPLRNSSLGYIAVASALYKLATPARYMVTLGGTTVSIKILTKRGLIKPVPTKDKLKTMIQTKLNPNKKDEL